MFFVHLTLQREGVSLGIVAVLNYFLHFSERGTVELMSKHTAGAASLFPQAHTRPANRACPTSLSSRLGLERSGESPLGCSLKVINTSDRSTGSQGVPCLMEFKNKEGATVVAFGHERSIQRR